MGDCCDDRGPRLWVQLRSYLLGVATHYFSGEAVSFCNKRCPDGKYDGFVCCSSAGHDGDHTITEGSTEPPYCTVLYTWPKSPTERIMAAARKCAEVGSVPMNDMHDFNIIEQDEHGVVYIKNHLGGILAFMRREDFDVLRLAFGQARLEPKRITVGGGTLFDIERSGC